MIVFGKNESALLGEGWHERETDGRVGFSYRATSQKANISVPLESDSNFLLFLISAPVAILGQPQSGMIRIGKNFRHPLKREDDRWGIEVVELALLKKRPSKLKMQFIAKHTESPHQFLGNGDRREFGWMISAIWQRKEISHIRGIENERKRNH